MYSAPPAYDQKPSVMPTAPVAHFQPTTQVMPTIIIDQNRVLADQLRMAGSDCQVPGVFCSYCKREVVTTTSRSMGMLAWFLCFFVSPCSLFCTMDTVHKCPCCKSTLGKHAAFS